MRRTFAGVLAAALVTVLAVPAAAAEGDIVVGGIVVLRIRFSAGGFTAAQRTVLVQQRITNALAFGKNIRVTIRMAGADPVIYAGDQMIITVDPDHARANGTTQRALAEVWARNLERGLAAAKPLQQPGGP